MPLTAVLLVLCLGLFVWLLRKDPADYRNFKLLIRTEDRQRRYRIWTIKSFLLFGLTTILCLALLGRLSALGSLPPEFLRLSNFLRDHGPSQSAISGFLIGVTSALIAGLFIGIFAARRKNKKQAEKPVPLGDIAAILPRNWAETAHTAVMSINAGFSEELYFRLLLPLLLASLIGKALPAFLIVAVIFGLAHFYQGVAGIIATTCIGLLLTAIYLYTGSIWVAVGLHAFIDLVGLVIRPSLSRVSSRSQPA